jgi:hypothetical protein
MHFYTCHEGWSWHQCQLNEAILNLPDRSLFHQEANERKIIKGWIKDSQYFLNCVGMVDGVMRETKNCIEDYFTHQSEYAIVAMVVCNDKKRIHYL